MNDTITWTERMSDI